MPLTFWTSLVAKDRDTIIEQSFTLTEQSITLIEQSNLPDLPQLVMHFIALACTKFSEKTENTKIVKFRFSYLKLYGYSVLG